MSSSPSAQAELARPKKLRLNAEQWQTLQALQGLAPDGAAPDIDGQMPGTGRLTSHGLVATDCRGCAYLTIFGLQRLNQGR